VIRGDNHADENLAAVCTRCHRRKSGQEGAQAKNWRQQ
jgi:5-methylcytosine-specific restriction endonuclease McrA